MVSPWWDIWTVTSYEGTVKSGPVSQCPTDSSYPTEFRVDSKFPEMDIGYGHAPELSILQLLGVFLARS